MMTSRRDLTGINEPVIRRRPSFCPDARAVTPDDARDGADLLDRADQRCSATSASRGLSGQTSGSQKTRG
jgi:hypothetical protein